MTTHEKLAALSLQLHEAKTEMITAQGKLLSTISEIEQMVEIQLRESQLNQPAPAAAPAATEPETATSEAAPKKRKRIRIAKRK